MITHAGPQSLFLLGLVVAAGAAASALTLVAVLPYLRLSRLALPNARSSHAIPTPQGGGLGVMAGLASGVLLWLALSAGEPVAHGHLLALAAATALLLVTGWYDDRADLPVMFRLAIHGIAAALVVASLPETVAVAPAGWMRLGERLLEWALLLSFVNITNFIDGLDEMTLAHAVPALAIAVILLHGDGAAPWGAPVLAALLGGLIGFWPWNRHVARLFLGDSGSLPLGLLLGYGVIVLAGRGHYVAAVLASLYPLSDGFLTLLRRKLAGERLTEAHRDHFYQLATRHGRSVPHVTALVFACGIALAAVSIASDGAGIALGAGALAVGAALVAATLAHFARRRS